MLLRSDEGRSGLKRPDIRVDVEAATQVPADAVPRKLQKRARGSWRVECGRGGGLHGCRPRFGNIFGTVVQQFALLDTEVQIRIPAAGLIADEQQRPSVFAFVEPVFQGVIENSNAGASLFDSTPRQGARHHPAPDVHVPLLPVLFGKQGQGVHVSVPLAGNVPLVGVGRPFTAFQVSSRFPAQGGRLGCFRIDFRLGGGYRPCPFGVNGGNDFGGLFGRKCADALAARYGQGGKGRRRFFYFTFL